MVNDQLDLFTATDCQQYGPGDWLRCAGARAELHLRSLDPQVLRPAARLLVGGVPTTPELIARLEARRDRYAGAPRPDTSHGDRFL
jgi:hypothetical protein